MENSCRVPPDTQHDLLRVKFRLWNWLCWLSFTYPLTFPYDINIEDPFLITAVTKRSRNGSHSKRERSDEQMENLKPRWLSVSSCGNQLPSFHTLPISCSFRSTVVLLQFNLSAICLVESWGSDSSNSLIETSDTATGCLACSSSLRSSLPERNLANHFSIVRLDTASFP